jgi:hypothetical protein
MKADMFRRTVSLSIGGLLIGCAATPEQQAAPFTETAATAEARARQSRRFDTTNRTLMLQATIGALQDLGFTIEETKAEYGIIVASKAAGGSVRAQVTLYPVSNAIIVRVLFQHIEPRPGAMLATGETLTDPVLYQGFFNKLQQSVFLTAHEI